MQKLVQNYLQKSMPTVTLTSLSGVIPAFYFGQFDGKSSKKQVTFNKWKIVKGDQVIVIAGKDKKKQGRVLKVIRKQNKVLVEGINTKFQRCKADPENHEKGGIKTIIHPIHVSNVALIDPETGLPTKIRFGYLADGDKVRLSKKSGSIIEKPQRPEFSAAERHKNKVDGVKDTPMAQVLDVTYKGEDFNAIKEEFQQFIQEKERKEKLLVFAE